MAPDAKPWPCWYAVVAFSVGKLTLYHVAYRVAAAYDVVRVAAQHQAFENDDRCGKILAAQGALKTAEVAVMMLRWGHVGAAYGAELDLPIEVNLKAVAVNQ